MASKPHHPETTVLHAGWRADPATGAVAVPIYQTTSYQFRDTEHAANLFALKELRQHLHPHHEPDDRRAGKARRRARRRRCRAGRLHRARRLRPSPLQNLARVGDNVVSSTDLYGGTWNLFANTLKDQGIEVRFVDPADPGELPPRHRRPHARLLCRDAAQSEAHRVPDRRGRRDRPRIRHSADRRQHRRADHRAAVRPWRRDHRLLHDQISRRPRHLDRRADRRRRQLPVGEIPRAPAGAEHAGPELSRRRLDARRSSRSDRSPTSSRRA